MKSLGEPLILIGKKIVIEQGILGSNSTHTHTHKKTNFKCFRVCLDGGVEKWKNRKLWEDGKYLVFPLMCLVGGMQKWESKKLFCLVGEKKGMV